MSLRLLLIVIGVVIVVGVYIFSSVKKRREARLGLDRRLGRRDLPDVILSHTEDEEDEAPPALERERHRISDVHLDLDDGPSLAPARASAADEAGPAAAPTGMPADLVLPPEHEVLGELPRVRNDALLDAEPDNARRSSNQLDLFGADSPDPEPPARRRARHAPPPPPPPELDDGLINLYVRAREQRPFGGPELVRALNAVGMRFGDMSIFHHYGAGELKSDTPVFSAANMFEPGTFDLNKIEAFRTSGIVLFLQLPAPLEGPVAFELLLSSAQRLAELTGGELFGTPRHPLDAHAIAALRQRAAHYSHASG